MTQDSQSAAHRRVAAGPTSTHSGQHTRYSVCYPQDPHSVVSQVQSRLRLYVHTHWLLACPTRHATQCTTVNRIHCLILRRKFSSWQNLLTTPNFCGKCSVLLTVRHRLQRNSKRTAVNLTGTLTETMSASVCICGDHGTLSM